ESDRSRLWNAVLRPVLRHPWVSTIAATWALVVLALPVVGLHTKIPGPADMSKSIPVVDAYSKIDGAFPGSQIPAVVIVNASNVDAPRVRTAIADLRREALATGEMTGPISTTVNPAHTVARVEIPLRGNGEDARSVHALSTLRGTILPNTIGRVAGVEHAVTGQTAGDYDFA